MRDQATAFWVEAPGHGVLRTDPIPGRMESDLLIACVVSAVSRGTESLVFRGEVPESLADRMRCPFQEGEFSGPLKYGYAAVGDVVDGPDAWKGKRVFVLHPHQDRFVVPATMATPVPAGIPPERAALAANMETAVNSLWDARPPVGARIGVVGGGVVGLFVTALAAQIPGSTVTLIDVDPGRADVAALFGARFCLPSAAPEGLDVVFHASGTSEGLATALAMVGDEADVIELSWYGEKTVAVPLGGRFHPGRNTIRSSQVGTVAPAMRPRWTFGDRMALALRLLADPRYDRFITGKAPFKDLPAVMEMLAYRPPPGTLAQIIVYG